LDPGDKYHITLGTVVSGVIDTRRGNELVSSGIVSARIRGCVSCGGIVLGSCLSLFLSFSFSLRLLLGSCSGICGGVFGSSGNNGIFFRYIGGGLSICCCLFSIVSIYLR
jgi:hypothetical protein